MRITVLGRWGGCCRAGEACAGYLVESAGAKVLLDCGSGVAGKLQECVELTEVDHVLLSHWHADHVGDAGVLLYGRLIHTLLGLTEVPLTFYALAQEPDLGRLCEEPYAASYAIDENSVVHIDDLQIRFARTRHPVPCLAMRVESGGKAFAYTADASYTPELAQFCKGVDLLVSECSLYGPAIGGDPGHMHPLDVARLAEAAQPRLLVLSHLPVYGDVEELPRAVREHWGGDVRLAANMGVYEM